jgi:short-subunit dehydrogenase
MKQTTPRTALVTGASTGIGRELVQLLAADGFDLILAARQREALETVAAPWRAKGRTVDVLPIDLAQPGAAQSLYSQAKQLGRQVDVLINNAGFGTSGLFHEIPVGKDAGLLQLNVVALTELCRLFLPDMVARKQGRILNVASLGAFQPGPYMAVYCASKAYVLSFSEAINSELDGTGVTVSTLCPGPVLTEFQKRADCQSIPLFRGKMLDATTVARLGYRGMMKGQAVILPGWKTKLLAFSNRLGPRSLAVKIAKGLLKPS